MTSSAGSPTGARTSLGWLRYRPSDDPALAALVETWERRALIPARTEVLPHREVTRDDLAAINLVGDPLAENFLLAKAEASLKHMDDMEALDALRARDCPAAVDLWTAINHVPAVFDFEAMRPAAGFVYRNAMPFAVLQLGAFPFTYTSANVAHVLDFSGRLGRDGDVVRRYWETVRATFAAYEIDDMQPGGGSWARWVRIRLMHSRVRMGIARSGRWNYRDGTPVSALNITGGMYAFSSYILHTGRALGVQPTPREAYAITRLWQWVAYLQGAPPELLHADLGLQAKTDRDLIRFVYNPTDAARRLTDDWIEAASAGMAGAPFPRWFVRAAVRRLLAASLHEMPDLAARVADDMHVPRSRLGERALRTAAAINRVADTLLRTRVLQPRAERLGRNLAHRSIERGLGGVDADHRTPLG